MAWHRCASLRQHYLEQVQRVFRIRFAELSALRFFPGIRERRIGSPTASSDNGCDTGECQGKEQEVAIPRIFCLDPRR